MQSILFLCLCLSQAKNKTSAESQRRICFSKIIIVRGEEKDLGVLDA